MNLRLVGKAKTVFNTIRRLATAQGKMRIECSWCGKHMGWKPGPTGVTTHGICPECRAEQEA